MDAADIFGRRLLQIATLAAREALHRAGVVTPDVDVRVASLSTVGDEKRLLFVIRDRIAQREITAVVAINGKTMMHARSNPDTAALALRDSMRFAFGTAAFDPEVFADDRDPGDEDPIR